MAFLVVYSITCYVGAMLLMVGGSWVREVYVFLAGVYVPPFSAVDVLEVLLLLHLAPALVICGWIAAERLPFMTRRRATRQVSATRARRSQIRGALALLGLALAYVGARLVSVGSFGPSAWSDYSQFIEARKQLVASLTFFDFTLIYTLVPLLIGFLIAEAIIARAHTRITVIRIGLLLVTLLSVNLALFQKRSAIAALLLAGAYVLLRADCWERLGIGRRPRTVIAAAALAVTSVASIYFVGLIVPLLSPSQPAPASGLRGDRILSYSWSFKHGAPGWSPGSTAMPNNDGRMYLARGRSGSALELAIKRPGQGAAVSLKQPAAAGSQWRGTLWLRSDPPQTMSLLIGGELTELQRRPVRAGSGWRRYQFDWSPDRDIPQVSFGIAGTRPGHAYVDDVTLRITSQLPARKLVPPSRFGLPVTPGKKPARNEGQRPEQPPDQGGVVPPGVIRAGALLPTALTFPSQHQGRTRSRRELIILTSLFGPLLRTAGPAVTYPVIYPERHPYYAPDIGLDLIGLGATADDNVSSWNVIFLQTPGGNNSVPYQFTLFSQGGLPIVLLGSLLIGAAWRAFWQVGYLERQRTIAGPAIGALAIIFGLSIAGDSVRNALVASYGIVWPLAVIAGYSVVSGVLRRLAHGIDEDPLPPRAMRARASD